VVLEREREIMLKVGDQVKTLSDVKATDYITILAGTVGEIYEIPNGPKVRVMFAPKHLIGLQWVPSGRLVKA